MECACFPMFALVLSRYYGFLPQRHALERGEFYPFHVKISEQTLGCFLAGDEVRHVLCHELYNLIKKCSGKS